MATNVYTIPLEYAVAVQDRIMQVIYDEYPIGYIPLMDVEGEPYTVRLPYMSAEDVSKGILDWDNDQIAANALLNYTDVKITGRQIKIAWNSKDLRLMSSATISAKVNTIIDKFVQELNYAIFFNNIQGTVTLATGLTVQATDGSSLVTAAQTTAQLVFANIKALYQAIPSKWRSRAPCVCMLDWKSYDLLSSGVPTGFTITALQVLNQIYPNLAIVPTDTVLKTDDVAGTNGRMLVFAQHEDCVRLILAKDISPVGPALPTLDGGVEQIWGALFALKVIEATAVQYTDTTLTFA